MLQFHMIMHLGEFFQRISKYSALALGFSSSARPSQGTALRVVSGDLLERASPSGFADHPVTRTNSSPRPSPSIENSLGVIFMILVPLSTINESAALHAQRAIPRRHPSHPAARPARAAVNVPTCLPTLPYPTLPCLPLTSRVNWRRR